MFAARRTARVFAHGSPSRNRTTPASRRGFVGSTIQTLSDGFLDLALALPLPPSFPPYSTTIILVTVVSRFALTVPFSVWAKKRQWRAEELVAPQVIGEKAEVEQRILKEMQSERARGTKDELRGIFVKRVQNTLKARRKELISKYRCNPIVTMLVPPVTQLPVFVGTSIVLSSICQPPTVFDSESFLTLTSLAHADPTATLPVVLGLVTLANVESARWFISDTTLEREKQEEKRLADKRAQGHIVIEPRKVVRTGLRILSIGRILVASMVPGGVVVYWVSSATFGLFQSWVFDWWERQRALKRRVQLAGDAPSPAVPKATVPTPAVPRQRKKSGR